MKTINFDVFKTIFVEIALCLLSVHQNLTKVTTFLTKKSVKMVEFSQFNFDSLRLRTLTITQYEFWRNSFHSMPID